MSASNTGAITNADQFAANSHASAICHTYPNRDSTYGNPIYNSNANP